MHYTNRLSLLLRESEAGDEDESDNNDNLRVQWDLTAWILYPSVFDVRNVIRNK